MAETKSSQKVVIPRNEAESIKTNLLRVQDELIRVRDKAKEEADALDRIRGMIDLKYLNDLLSAVEALESRVKSMEKDSEAAVVQKQLEREQQRLARLWDAFKTQEDELKKLEQDRNALVARLEELEREYRSLGSVSSVRTRLDFLERENKRLGAEHAKAVARADEYQDQFEEEQQRLAKLFKVYEDAAATEAALRKEAEAWRAWYSKHSSKLPAAAKTAAGRIKKAK
jgi:chromosome segregation ATPase